MRLEVDEADAGRLATLLGCLPLALEQAAAYVERYRLSFAAYLGEWEGERERVLEWYDERRMHSFLLAELDDFEREVERTRKNEELMRLLDRRSEQQTTFTLDEVREQLGLQ